MPRESTSRRAPAQGQGQGQTSALTVQEANDQAMRRIVNVVTQKRDQLAMLLAGGVDPERFITVALAAVQTTPKLLECSPLSIFAAIREAATYGLELGPLGDASLTPYGGEASLSVEYRGYRKLAMRDGTVRVIAAEVVYEADAFRIVSGSESPGIYHEPALGERGNVVGAYAWARLTNSELVYIWMTEAELLKRRDVSKSYRTAIQYGRTDSIWHLWPIEMMRKTVIKRLCSEQLPLTPLLREVITRDTDADLARQEERAALQPGQLQGGDARARIMAAMGLDKPAELVAGAEAPQTAQDAAEDVDAEVAAAEAFEAAQAAGAAPAVTQSVEPETIAACGSPSPYDDVPEPCNKLPKHRLVCGNGKATWEKPKGCDERSAGHGRAAARRRHRSR
jgi:recombination protein RecT